MDPLDIAILNYLRDGKPKEFKQILTAVKLSHNTLRHHLDSLEDQNIITKSKQPVKGRGRPTYVYSLSSGGRKVALMIRSGVEGVVALPFSSLGQVCRF
jgi:predicted ArsR family transcriptional regulator